jgi:tetratricopeptide (TPR) repeat protein
MSRLVVCYRIEDASPLTRQIVDQLRQAYPAWPILEITQAQRFQELHGDDSVILLIGAAWDIGGMRGQQWLDKLDDPVHMTISATLVNHNGFLIPVLLNNTPTPQETDLPLEFEKLSHQEFFKCHTNRFENDMNRILQALKVRYASRGKTRWSGTLIAVVLLISLCGGLFAFTRSESYQAFLGRFNDAIERLDSNSPDYYYNLGQESYNAGNYGQAIDNFSRAIKLRDNYADAFSGLGWTYYELSDYEKARESFDRQVELAPYSLKSYEGRGQFEQAIGDLTGAIADFEQSAKISPNNEIVYMELAQGYQQSKEYEKAIGAFQRVTQINSGNADAYRGLGESNDALGEVGLAIQGYQRYIELAESPDPTVVARLQELQRS